MQSNSRSGRTMARAWLIAAIAFMCVCTYVVLGGRDLTYADKTGPGPGFFAVWVGSLGFLAGVGLIAFTAARGAPTELEWTWPARVDGIRIVLTIVAVALAGLALERLGFRLTIFLFVMGMLRLYGMRWRVAVPSAAASALLVHFVFGTLLKVQLPTGALGF